MRLVIDSSVAVKWFLRSPADEPHTEKAVALLSGLADGSLTAVQPPHWQAEVAAVLARLRPATAAEDLADLRVMGIPTGESTEIYRTGLTLAVQLNHHLFDTLYHAVALHMADGLLVTADERYFRKARALGRIARLADWEGKGAGEAGE
ncbi:MAG: type II toxin-antitoxin system VapC family toxin [Pseudomonadota bacterium]|jgi:predicted nucleic acid-binding protein